VDRAATDHRAGSASQLGGSSAKYIHVATDCLATELQLCFAGVPQPLSAHGWTSAFHPNVHRLCGAIEGRLSHFLPLWLRKGWRSVISQGKIP